MRQLTPPEALSAVNEALAIFRQPDNEKMLKQVVIECDGLEGLDAEQKAGMKISRLSSMIQEMLGDVMLKYGFESTQVVAAVMQIQMHALDSPALKKQVDLLMDAFSGKFHDAQAEESKSDEEEICD